jgi:hypothetical protein
MNDQHLLIVWDQDMEVPNGLVGYDHLTDATVAYILKHSSNPAIDGGCGTNRTEAEQKVQQVLDDFAGFLTDSIAPANIKVIVCSKNDATLLFLNSKEPIVYYPFQPMTMAEIEHWLIRGSLLQKQNRLTDEMEECLALLHRHEGVESINGIKDLWKATAGYFDQTRFRWGSEKLDPASSQGDGKAVA